MKSDLSESSRFPIVGIGASAGGVTALTELLSAIPADSGMAFVIVQHLDPTQPSMLGEVLARATAMKVTTAASGDEVEPDRVYVIPPNADILLAENTLQLVAREQSRKPHLAIDIFFRSLATQRRAQAIGVVLSGTGSDGTDGLRAIKAEGGITFAQDPRGQGERRAVSRLGRGLLHRRGGLLAGHHRSRIRQLRRAPEAHPDLRHRPERESRGAGAERPLLRHRAPRAARGNAAQVLRQARPRVSHSQAGARAV